MVIYEYHYNGGNLQSWYDCHKEDGGMYVAKFEAIPCAAPDEVSDAYEETVVGTVGFCDGHGWFRVVEMLPKFN